MAAVLHVLRRAAVAAVAFLALGLLDVGYPHRQVVDSSARGNDSDYIQARGFPVAWFVTEELPDLNLSFLARILPRAFSFDFAVLFISFAGPWFAVLFFAAIRRGLISSTRAA